MVAHRELGRDWFADARDLDGVVVGVPVGSVRIRRVGNLVEGGPARCLGRVELGLEALQVGLDRFQLLDLLRGGLPLQLGLSPQLVDAGNQVEPGAVGCEERIEGLSRALARERGTPLIGRVAGRFDVDHGVRLVVGFRRVRPETRLE